MVDDKGHVTYAWVDISSGDAAYDAASVKAMKSWTFVPAEAACRALPGESEFVVGGSDQTFAHPCQHDAIATLAANPEFPRLAIQANVPIDVEVTVSLDQFGEVSKIAVTRKSGSPGADEAALKAALASNYFPAVKECMPVAQNYIFRAGITP